MAYDRDYIEAQCLKAIEKHKLVFFSHLQLYIEPSLSTLYEWELEKSEKLKKAIEVNRINAKKSMLSNWVQPESAPVLQLAAFKLMADDHEFDRLATTKQDGKVAVQGVALNINMPDGE